MATIAKAMAVAGRPNRPSLQQDGIVAGQSGPPGDRARRARVSNDPVRLVGLDGTQHVDNTQMAPYSDVRWGTLSCQSGMARTAMSDVEKPRGAGQTGEEPVARYEAADRPYLATSPSVKWFSEHHPRNTVLAGPSDKPIWPSG